jgi:hypothetical protein
MPVTIGDIRQHLAALDLRYSVSPEDERELGVRFETHSYRDHDGDHSLLILCKLSDDGEYIEIFAPQAFNTSNCRYKAALFSAMLQLSFMTKHVQFEHDPRDGEIRLAVDLPVCDGTVTLEQFSRMLFVLTGILEEYDPVLRHAMQTGRIDWSKRWRGERDVAPDA